MASRTDLDIHCWIHFLMARFFIYHISMNTVKRKPLCVCEHVREINTLPREITLNMEKCVINFIGDDCFPLRTAIG